MNHFRFLSTAILGLLFWLAAYLIGAAISPSSDPYSNLEAIQTNISREQQLQKNNLEQLRIAFPKKNEAILTDLKALESDDKTYAIFIGNELVHWSDNSTPITLEAVKSKEAVPFLGNGWYLKESLQAEDTLYVSFLLLKQMYSYENQYLNSHWSSTLASFGINEITFSPQQFNISNPAGEFLFSITFNGEQELPKLAAYLIFSLYLLGYICLLFCLWYSFRTLFKKSVNRTYSLLIFTTLIINYIIYAFQIPEILFNHSIFSPLYYASGTFSPSLGHFLLNSVTAIILAFIAYNSFPALKKSQKRNFIRALFLLLLSVVTMLSTLIPLHQIVTYSSLHFNLSDIFTIETESWIGLCAATFYIGAAALLTLLFLRNALSGIHWGIVLVLQALFSLILSLLPQIEVGLGAVLIAIAIQWILVWILNANQLKNRINFAQSIVLLLIFAVLSSVVLNRAISNREKQIRHILSFELTEAEHDPIAEFLFGNLQSNIQNDVGVMAFANSYNSKDEESYYRLQQYIKSYFLTGYWKNYNIEITICDSTNSIFDPIQKQAYSCHYFFEDLITSIGSETTNPALTLLRYSPVEAGYLACFPLSAKAIQPQCYIEFVEKSTEVQQGYPDLLIDAQSNSRNLLQPYSYAKYFNNQLVSHSGSYAYIQQAEKYIASAENGGGFFDENNFSHFVLTSENGITTIISYEHLDLFSRVAPIAYLFVIFSIFLLFATLFILLIGVLKINFSSLELRIQLFIVSTLIACFTLIGYSIIGNFKQLNEEKDSAWLKERGHSILLELEGKTGSHSEFTAEDQSDIVALLEKFSSIFFSDINLFKPNGELYASSRTQVFSESLIASYMNPIAFEEVSRNQKSTFVHTEKIGKQNFLSVYIPLKNRSGELLAYINLPYFTRVSERDRELAQFIMSFFNVYTLIIVFALLLSIVLSNQITRPLQILRRRFADFRLGTEGNKVEWNAENELGELVNEYNTLVDKLEDSVKQLAKSEREGAWSNMARQIAHEVRNSLTPIKLSVQQLQRAWNDQAPDFSERLRRTTDTLIDQIAALDSVAGGFSDFARLPNAQRHNMSLYKTIDHTTTIFSEYGVDIHTDRKADRGLSVFADDQLLLRVFNNLLKNAIQAIHHPPTGLITITVNPPKEGFVLISVSDNGCGISPSEAKKIFAENYTTKDDGMGLGLSMVKTIIEDNQGKVWLESEVDRGTTFFFTIPISQPNLHSS